MPYMGLHLLCGERLNSLFSSEESFTQFLLGTLAPDTNNITVENETYSEYTQRLKAKSILHFTYRNEKNIAVWKQAEARHWAFEQTRLFPETKYFFLGFIHHLFLDDEFRRRFYDELDYQDSFENNLKYSHERKSQPAREKIRLLQNGFQQEHKDLLLNLLNRDFKIPILPKEFKTENFIALFNQTAKNLSQKAIITKEQKVIVEGIFKSTNTKFLELW
jgi:hypothetical protein